MGKINLSDEIWGDIIRIFMDDEISHNDKNEIEVTQKGFLVTKYISDERGESITFDDCVSIAKENGFTEGEFFIMADTPLEGKIYLYANCYEENLSYLNMELQEDTPRMQTKLVSHMGRKEDV